MEHFVYSVCDEKAINQIWEGHPFYEQRTETFDTWRKKRPNANQNSLDEATHVYRQRTAKQVKFDKTTKVNSLTPAEPEREYIKVPQAGHQVELLNEAIDSHFHKNGQNFHESLVATCNNFFTIKKKFKHASRITYLTERILRLRYILQRLYLVLRDVRNRKESFLKSRWYKKLPIH